MRERDINGMAERYTYDDLSRIIRVTNIFGRFTNNYVNQTFRLSSIKYPNGQNMYCTYYGTNDDFRLQSIWHKRTNDTATLAKYEYTYDKEGQIATWAQTAEFGSSNTWVMEYDLADQLRAVTIRTNGIAGAILKRHGYTYDKAGNRTGEQIDDVPNQGTVNDLNQLLSINSAGPTRFAGWLDEAGTVKVAGNSAWMTTATNFAGLASTTVGTNIVSVIAKDWTNNFRTNLYQVVITNGLPTTLTYDANGNLTNQYTSTYTNSYAWDGEDRLVSITRRSVGDPIEYKSEFLYDGLGRRVRIVECGTEICEKRNSGGGTTEIRYFAHGEHIGTGPLYYTRDHLGSIRELVGGGQKLRARYDYDPYGRRTQTEGDLDTSFGYTGHMYHGGSGLHLAMYRALDSGNGRWVSRDPIQELGGLNYYAYVDGNPVNTSDPLGLFSSLNTPAGAAALAFALGTGVSAGIWHDQLASYVTGQAECAKQIVTENLPWWIAGSINTIIDLGAGLAQTPAAIAHLGEGTGVFSVDPTLENLALVFQDISVAAGVMAAGLSPTPIGNARIGWRGGEISFTRPGATTPDLRINPFGGSGYPPHYHRRPGIGKHRPWQGGF